MKKIGNHKMTEKRLHNLKGKITVVLLQTEILAVKMKRKNFPNELRIINKIMRAAKGAAKILRE